jgi:uncharacterized protein YaaQ
MKRLWLTIFAIVLAFTLAAPAQAEFQDMWAKVYKYTGGLNSDGSMKLAPVTSGVTFTVLAKDANTAETLYVYGKNTYIALANPVSTTNFASSSYCNGQVQFRVDPTDSSNDRYVDLLVTDTNGGFTAFVKDFDKYNHTIVIDERPNIEHHGCVWFTGSTTNQTSSGVTFLKGQNVRSMQLEVVTALSGGTISVGRLGAATSFINAESLTNTGFITTSIASTGTDLGNGSNFVYPHGYAVSSDTTLYYTVSSTTGTPAGYIHYYFSRGR